MEDREFHLHEVEFQLRMGMAEADAERSLFNLEQERRLAYGEITKEGYADKVSRRAAHDRKEMDRDSKLLDSVLERALKAKEDREWEAKEAKKMRLADDDKERLEERERELTRARRGSKANCQKLIDSLLEAEREQLKQETLQRVGQKQDELSELVTGFGLDPSAVEKWEEEMPSTILEFMAQLFTGGASDTGGGIHTGKLAEAIAQEQMTQRLMREQDEIVVEARLQKERLEEAYAKMKERYCP